MVINYPRKPSDHRIAQSIQVINEMEELSKKETINDGDRVRYLQLKCWLSRMRIEITDGKDAWFPDCLDSRGQLRAKYVRAHI